jgi:uncharacterized protein with ATP-grasp and redox domains
VSYTREALKLLPHARGLVAKAEDSLEAAVRVSIAGNLIDFGTGSELKPLDLEKVLADFMTRPFFHSDVSGLQSALAGAEAVLVVGDNAGENVFDRPLLEQLEELNVTYAARGGPVINDATVADARLAGIHLHARLVSTGADIPGVVPESCSPGFMELFETADLIIAKGQGNFETLTELPKSGKIFMLFSVKCEVAARQVGGALGDMVVMKW